MFMSRDKAFRRWKTFIKYVSKIKKRMGWYIVDPNVPRGHRNPKNWKELDNNNSRNVKMLKKTSTRWSSKWEDCDDHKRIKELREESRKIINKELNNLGK